MKIRTNSTLKAFALLQRKSNDPGSVSQGISISNFARILGVLLLIGCSTINNAYATRLMTLAGGGNATGTICAPTGSPGAVVYSFSLHSTGSQSCSFDQLTFTTAGYSAGDVTSYDIYTNHSSNTMTGASLVDSRSTPGAPGTFTFNSVGENINSGNTYYYFIVANVSAGAVIGNHITISGTTNANVNSNGTVSGGPLTIGGAQTFAAPPAISGLSTVCVGTTVTLNGTPSGGVWASGTPGVATVGTSTGVVGGVLAGTTTISYTQGGCTGTLVETSTTTSAPSFSVTPSAATICGSGSQLLSAPVSGGSTTVTFTQSTPFSVPDNSSAGTSSTVSVSGIPVDATIVDVAVDLISVTMAHDRDLQFNIKAPSGSILNLVDQEGGFIGGANFTNTVISSASGANFTSAPFTGTFGADESSFAGPTGFLSNVTSWPTLFTTPNGTWTLAVRDRASSNVATVNSWAVIIHYTVPAANYTWSPTTGLYTNSGLTTPYAGAVTNTVYASPASPTTYTATKSEAGFCNSTSTSVITVGAPPALTGMTASQNLCFNASAAQVAPFAYTGITNSATQYTLTWSPAGPSNVSSFTALPGTPGGTINVNVPAGTAANTYTGTLTITNAAGCTTTSSLTLTVGAAPALTGLTTNQSFCFNAASAQTAAFAYTGINNGANQYTLTWSPASVLADVASFTALPGSPSGTINVTVPAGATANTYTGTLTVKNSSTGCLSATSVTTVVNSLPSLTGLSTAANLCFNASSAQTASYNYTGVNNGANQYTLSWSPAGPAAVASFTALPGSPSGTFNVTVPAGTAAASYTGTLTVKNATTGCTSTATITMVVNGTPALTGLPLNTGVCFNPTSSQTASFAYTGVNNGANQYTLSWSPAGPSNVASFSAIPGSPSGTISVFVPAATAAGGYTGTLTVRNSATGCTSTSSINLTINGLPSLTGFTTNQNLCFDGSSDQTAPFGYTGVINGADQYLLSWAPGGSLLNVVSPTSLPGFASGTFNVNVPAGTSVTTYSGTLILLNSTTGCSATTTITSVVNDVPTLSGLTTNQSLCFNGAAAQTASFAYTSSTADQYTLTWSPGAVLADVASFTTLPAGAINVNIPAGTAPGNYTGTLTVRNSLSGCISSYILNAAVNGTPALTGLSANQAFCFSASAAQTASFTYTGIANAADQYMLTWAPGSVLADVASFISLPGTPSGSIDVTVPAGAAPGTYNGTLTVRNSLTGCPSAATITVVVNGLPALTGLSTSQKFCFDAASSASATFPYTGTANGADQYTLTWLPGGVMADVSSFTSLAGGAVNVTVPAGAAATTYTGTLTVKNSVTGCTTTTSVTITVDPLPALTGLTANQTFCFNASSAQSALFAYTAATNGADQYTLSWAPGGTLTEVNVASAIPAGTVNVNVPAGTPVNTYTGTLIVQNSVTGCATSNTITTVVNPLPDAGAITGTLTVCPLAVTNLSDLATGGVWSTTAPATATVDNTGSVTGLAAGTATIDYTVNNSCGTAIVSKDVTVNPVPSPASITGTANVCVGSVTTLGDASIGGSWTTGDNTLATVDPTGVVSGVSGGTVTISYGVTNDCGTGYATTGVTVYALPQPITGTLSVCQGSTTPLSDITSGGTWSSNNAIVASIDAGGVVTGITSSGFATITYTSVEGCITTTGVTVNPLPAPISGAGVVCGGGAVTTLSDIAIGGTWSSSDAGVAIATAGAPGVGIITGVSFGSPSITYTLPTGCMTATTILVNPAPLPISGTTNVCFGTAISLIEGLPGGTWTSSDMTVATVDPDLGVVTGVTPGTAVISYTFSTGCKATVPVVFQAVPAAVTGSTNVCIGATTPLADVTTGGTWSSSDATLATVSSLGVVTGVSAGSPTISYVIGTGCTAVATLSINPPPPAPGAVSGSVTVCQLSAISLSDATSGGSWSSSNTSVASIDAASGLVLGLTAGTTNISYTVTNACGSTSATSFVTVNALPVTPAAITGTTTVCEASGTLLNDVTSGGTWTSADPGVATVNAAGMVTGLSGGTTSIVYTKTNTCGTAFTSAAVTVNPLPTTPAAITGTTSVCAAGAVTTLGETTVGGSWSSSNFLVASVSPSGDVTGHAAGLAAISYTMVNGCGSVSATAWVTVNPLPATPSVITGISSAVCPGTGTTLHNATPGGVWSSSDVTVATINSTGIATAVAAGSATISYTESNGCGTAYATTALFVNPLPVADPISGVPFVCAGSVTALHDMPAAGTWLSDNTSVAIVNSLGIVTGMAPGTATISYVAENSCGSSDAATVTVTVNQLPDAGTITGNTRVCINDTIVLSNIATGGTWSSADNSIALVNAAGVVTGVFPGTDNIIYTYTNVCGTVTARLAVTVPNPGDCVSGTRAVANSITELKAYPNPNEGTFTINLVSDNSEPVHVTVTNVVGEVVKEYTTTTNKELNITLSSPAGIYLVSAITEHDRYQAKVVIR